MNKIPLSVSSTLSVSTGPMPLAVTPYGNATGKTGTAAPVLIAVESDATIGAEAFAAALPAKGGQGTEAQARLVVNALAGVLSDLVAEYGAISAATPFGRVETFVAGSLEYATDPVDPEVNVPFLGIVPGADVMKTFAQMETYVPTAACPASLKRVRDVLTGDNAIHGAMPFYAQGYGMTYGGTGETVKLLNLLTRAEICNVSVDAATKSEAQLKCTLPNTSAIPAGQYLLQVKTLAGGSAALWPLELKVTLAEAVTPTPVPSVVTVSNIRDVDQVETNSYIEDGKNVRVTGTGLAVITGDTITCKGTFREEGGETTRELSSTCTVISSSATEMILEYPFTSAQEAGLDVNMTNVTFTFKMQGGVAGAPIQTVNHNAYVVV